MSSRPWLGPAVAATVFLLLAVAVGASPATAARMVKGGYRGLPASVRASIPDEAETRAEALLEGSARVLSLGQPRRLAQLDLELKSAQPPLETWGGDGRVFLEWTDLASSSITYDLRYGPEGTTFSQATPAGAAAQPRATVEVPADGAWTIWVRPRANTAAGHPTPFGPFLIDATPPPAPVLKPIETPPGYRFQIAWTASSDLSGIGGYEVERRRGEGAWEGVATVATHVLTQDQVGNGVYDYRVRALNGAGVPSPWSSSVRVEVQAPLGNPGAGVLAYGVHANYTGFLYLWDLSRPDAYLNVSDVPADVRGAYLGEAPSIEVHNATLRAVVAAEVGNESNTLRIALRLFEFLYNQVDYDPDKITQAEGSLQRAGQTLDSGKGICGDLAVLYVTLLRIAGVPARPVHGYLDNARSGVGGFHMWVEVFVGPANGSHPWLTVDVSGVTGTYDADQLFAYFGVFNPDYLALGTERNYARFDDGQWNTWARLRYVDPAGPPTPQLTDVVTVDDYGSENGRLFFDAATRRTVYQPCVDPNPAQPANPCPDEAAPAGFSKYFALKGVSKKRIDYGANLGSYVPTCVVVELRVPQADTYGSVVPDQSSLFHVYENSASPNAQVGLPDGDGWVRLQDGSAPPPQCSAT